MKKTGVLLAILASTCVATNSSAAILFGSNVDSLHKHFDVTDAGQSTISGLAGLAWDPTHTDVNGDFDRIYAVNRTTSNAKRGLYSIDVANETSSARLALGSVGSINLDNPSDVTVDASGNAYVTISNTPSVWKITDPSGVATETQLIGNYAGAGDDDPDSIGLVHSGFGGGFAVGADLVVYDAGIDDNNAEGISVLDAASTLGVPDITTLFSEDILSSNLGIKGDTSPVDGLAYYARSTVETDLLGGVSRPFINRINGAGVIERVFLDSAGAAFSTDLDDTIAVHPIDGSVWLAIESGVSGVDTEVWRVDVLAASDEGSGDFLASATLEIFQSGTDAYNIGTNGLAFSPDGKFLAVGAPSGVDSIYIYNLIPEPTSLALLCLAGLALPRRRAC